MKNMLPDLGVQFCFVFNTCRVKVHHPDALNAQAIATLAFPTHRSHAQHSMTQTQSAFSQQA